jgi:hypothetical protein
MSRIDRAAEGMVAVVSQDTAFSLLDNSTSVLNIRLLINKLSQFRHGPNSPLQVLVLASQILLRAHRASQAEKGVPLAATGGSIS